jgi:hypothetical protein
MFGNTYPIVGIDVMSEWNRDHALAEYVRLEFRPAERRDAMFALRRARLEGRSRRRKPRLAERIRSWRAGTKPTGDPTQP